MWSLPKCAFILLKSSKYYVQVQIARLASLDGEDSKTEENSLVQNKLMALQS